MRQSEIFLVALPPEVLAVARQAAHLAFPDSQLLTVEHLEDVLQFRLPDGGRLVVLDDSDPASVAAATQVIDAAGAPRWAVVVLGRDASELAEAVPPEEWNPPLLARVFHSALLQHELLCENLRLRGDLKTVARRISHDIRTSVGCIHTSSDLFKELDADSQAMMIGVIRQSSVEIAQIVDRVSFLLKASADPLSPAKVGMGAAVAVALRQLASEIQSTGAQVTQPATWPDVSGVSPWLQVVWKDLLGNALRFGGPSPQVQIAWREEKDGFRFSVTDRGPGVEPRRQAGLFPSFDQLHVLHTQGFGLAIAQRLITLQRGRCGYEKPAEGGACFYFSLPAADVKS